MTNTPFRACNGCRFRKVRCNGAQPCAQCAHLNLACVFTAAPVKRKRSARGHMIAHLRGKTHGNVISTSTTSFDRLATATIIMAEAPDAGQARGQLDAVTSNRNTGYAPDFFINLLSEFEQFIYPGNPIIPPEEIRACIANMHNDYEDAALVYVFAAVTTKLVRSVGALHDAADAQIVDLIRHSSTAHRQVDMHDMDRGILHEHRASVKRIMTCIFLSTSMTTSQHFDRSFIILREGIAMIQTFNIHQSSTARCQRLYWEAYIHERYVCVVTGYPCILGPLATGLPPPDPGLPPHIHVGFDRLIRLFLILDGPFLDYWTAQRNPSQVVLPRIPAEWIESKQVQLDNDELGAVEAERKLVASGHGPLTEAQHVDLFVTRLWMRTLIWQLALSHGLLRSTPSQDAHEGLSLHFPAQRLSAQLHNLVSRLGSVSSVAMHGSGILQKLFETTSSIADVLALPLGHGQTRERMKPQIENFVFLAKFLLGFERVREEQKDYLREKLDVLQRSYSAYDFSELA